MTETILALLIAIKGVESAGGMDPKANGNNYQITSVCVRDVNQKYGLSYRWPDDVRNDDTARDIAMLYLCYYGMVYKERTGRVPSTDILARIWNRGYRGAMRGEGVGYARKVRKNMKRLGDKRKLKGKERLK